MNIQSRLPTTPDEFLRWNEGREGKREFVLGMVVEMMIDVTKDHWHLANRLTRQLAAQLSDERYDVGSADYGVRTPDGIRFPDVLVDTTLSDGKSLATSSPLLVAEILLKSSMTADFGPKARDSEPAIASALHDDLTRRGQSMALVAKRGWLLEGAGDCRERNCSLRRRRPGYFDRSAIPVSGIADVPRQS